MKKLRGGVGTVLAQPLMRAGGREAGEHHRPQPTDANGDANEHKRPWMVSRGDNPLL